MLLNQLSDEELVQHFKNHQTSDVLAILFNRYKNFIFQTCLRYLNDPTSSEDALMDIFVVLSQKLSQYKIQNFKSWLFFVTRNHCYKLCKTRIHLQSIDGIQEIPTDAATDEDHPTGPTTIQLAQAINHLKEQQRICIELFYFQGKSYAEISKEVKIDIKKVKSHIQNGKLRLRKLIA